MKKLLTLLLSVSLIAQPVFASYMAYPMGDGSVEVTGMKDPDKETTFLIKNISGTDIVDLGQVGAGDDEFSKILYIGEPDNLTYNVEIGSETVKVKNVSAQTALAELEEASYTDFESVMNVYNKIFKADTGIMDYISDKEAAYKALADFDFTSPENVADEYALALEEVINNEKQKALELVANRKSDEAIEKYLIHFDVDAQSYEDVVNKKYVYDYLNGNTYNEESFVSAFNDAVIIAKISEAADDEFVSLLKQHSDKIGMEFGTDVKDAVYQKLSGKVFKSYEDIKKSFIEEISLDKLNTATADDIMTVLKDENDILGLLDVPGYSALSDAKKKSVCEALTRVDFDTIAEAKDEFAKIVERAKAGTPSAPGSSSSSSSGGGGGYAVSGGTTQAPERPGALPFTDVAGDYWGYEAISELYKQKIVSGATDTSFEPERHITREEFIKMLVGTFGMYSEDAENVFTDVDSSHWSASYVASAYKAGLTLGKGDGSFGIGETLTRQDMAVLSARCADIAGFKLPSEASVEFTDETQFSDYAKESIYTLASAGIINGMGNGTFSAKTSCTRAMAAKVCYELLKLSKGGKR